MLRDPEFGPVRLRAFGTYAIQVNDPAAFVRQIVGTNSRFTTDGITDQLRNMIVSRFTDILGESKIPVLDLAANYDELGQFISNKISPEFEEYGLDLTKMLVENISLPPEVEEALDKRSSMGVIGNLNKYTQYQSAEAIRDAAQNEGGAAASGMGMGMGFAMGNQMARTMGREAVADSDGAGAAPPPLPSETMYHIAVNNQPMGPFDLGTLSRKIQTGELTRETLVWSPGMDNWVAARDANDLQELFGAAPPPLPPNN